LGPERRGVRRFVPDAGRPLPILLVVTGFGLFSRQAWAGVTAIFLAMLTAVENFFFIPYYPFCSIVVIALAVWVIWALTRPGAIEV
jgi:hypothetical protein